MIFRTKKKIIYFLLFNGSTNKYQRNRLSSVAIDASSNSIRKRTELSLSIFAPFQWDPLKEIYNYDFVQVLLKNWEKMKEEIFEGCFARFRRNSAKNLSTRMHEFLEKKEDFPSKFRFFKFFVDFFWQLLTSGLNDFDAHRPYSPELLKKSPGPNRSVKKSDKIFIVIISTS